jgi:ADP-heptose:LPS heptosyltransferase
MSGIGDAVHSTIIPQAIKNKHPEIEIHCITNYININIFENCPHIDKVFIHKNKIWDTYKLLSEEKYDLIINLNHTLKNLILSLLLHPKRIVSRGYKGTSWVENYFYTAQKIFKDITLPEKLILENNKDIEKNIAKKLSAYQRPFITINPGRKDNNIRQGRLWNISKWKELTKQILKTYGGTIFVIGSDSEKKYHEILKSTNVEIFSGKYNLKETCAIISMSDLCIAGDTGTIHIASAYNINALSILGSTSPDKIKPYGKKGFFVQPKTKCKYCWKKKCKYLQKEEIYTPCIESITPNTVLKIIKTKNLLNSNR